MKQVLSAILATLLSVSMAACTQQESAVPSSQAESAEVVESISSSSEPASVSSTPESSQASAPVSSTPESSQTSAPAPSATSEIVVAVIRETIQGESVTITLTDPKAQEQTLAFVQSLVASELETPPVTGGAVYTVRITPADGAAVEEYIFTGLTNDDGFIMAKKLGNPRVWLLADAASYDYLASLFA